MERDNILTMIWKSYTYEKKKKKYQTVCGGTYIFSLRNKTCVVCCRKVNIHVCIIFKYSVLRFAVMIIMLLILEHDDKIVMSF